MLEGGVITNLSKLSGYYPEIQLSQTACRACVLSSFFFFFFFCSTAFNTNQNSSLIIIIVGFHTNQCPVN